MDWGITKKKNKLMWTSEGNHRLFFFKEKWKIQKLKNIIIKTSTAIGEIMYTFLTPFPYCF